MIVPLKGHPRGWVSTSREFLYYPHHFYYPSPFCQSYGYPSIFLLSLPLFTVPPLYLQYYSYILFPIKRAKI